jgi:hypothetical protein
MIIRASLKIVLILAGLVTVIAMLSFTAAAVVRTTPGDVDYPDPVYLDEEMTVSYTLSISGGTWEDLNGTGVTWSTGFIGEFYNHSNDPRSVGVPANQKNSYTMTLTIPDTVGEYILWGWVHQKGFVTDETHNLGTFQVKETPVVQFAGSLGWNLVGQDHQVTANVRNADPSEIEEVSVYWDTRSHSDDLDKANYPNRTDVVTFQLLTPYFFNISLPNERAVVYILVHGSINGRDFYDVAERGISVFEEPEIDDYSTNMSIRGRSANINWSILGTPASQLENTTVYWDIVSHAGAVDKANYAFSSDTLTSDENNEYGVMLMMPDEVLTVYYVIHCVIKMYGYEYYTDVELTIGVIEVPTVTVTHYPDSAFTGEDVHLIWTVSANGWAVGSTSVHWDTTSHAGSMDKASYPGTSHLLTGEHDRTYEVMMTMPDEAGTLYFIAYAYVLGWDFYVAEELSIVVHDLPTIEVTKVPTSAFVGADVQFIWTVDAPAAAVAETAIHWDTTSHAGTMDVSEYPNASVWMIGEDDQTYDVTFEMPDEAGTLYFIAHAIVYERDVYVAEEMSIVIRDLPGVSITEYVDAAFMEETVAIEWEVTGALETDNFITMVHWDVVSHSDDQVPSNYAAASYGIEWKEAGVYSYNLDLPEVPGPLYLMASAIVKGMTFVSDEVMITVKALPSVGNITIPEDVVGGKTVTLTFTLNDVDDPELVELLWGPESLEGDTNYPNVVAATDNGNGTWTVEFEPPNEDMEIFYRVHIQDDGNEVYSNEAFFDVDKKDEKEDDSPGFTMVLVVLAISLIAVYVATDRR